MQSNSDFISQFPEKIPSRRTLVKSDARFRWTDSHQNILKEIILRYFDLGKQTFIFVEAYHYSSLGAILAQGEY